MPFERFTDRARTIVDLSVAEAAGLGDDSVDSVHVLLGMIREGQGVAGHVLAEHGIDADAVCRSINSVRNEPDVTLADMEARSMIEATWLGHNYAGTEHLLLRVCCLTPSRAARILSDMGKHPVQLCHTVLEILGHLDEWNRWLDDHPELA
jgi:ATP-dependent Clp protease ATP-binding subunit ClpC